MILPGPSEWCLVAKGAEVSNHVVINNCRIYFSCVYCNSLESYER